MATKTSDTIPAPPDTDVDPLHAGPQATYAAYVADAGGVNFQGERCPAWPDLPEAIRQHWRVAFVAARAFEPKS